MPQEDVIEPADLSDRRFDLIVVGGGVQGAATALLAAEAGRRTLLLEKGRFGGGVTGGWFGILHGGLRYLQSLDVGRLRASSADRGWFMRRFPEAVATTRFLMPLYGRGMKRAEVFRLAFAADAALTWDRNRGAPPGLRLPKGSALGSDDVVRLFPGVRRDGLRGGALWTEATEIRPGAILDAMISAARKAGAVALEGIEATGLALEKGRVAGVDAMDVAAGRERRFDAPVVVNAAGPSAGALAARFDPTASRLFRPALGFNLVLDRPPPAEVGLALSAPGHDAMLFLQPRGSRTFAGTWYAPRNGECSSDPTEEELAAFLAALNAAAPTLAAGRDHVVEVASGLLPAADAASTTLSDRDVLHDHGRSGGPKGLHTAIGVKFTTARRLALRTLRRAKLT